MSFDKAKAVVRVAAPDTESALVELALHATTGQTQRICGKWRKVTERAATTEGGADSDVGVGERPTIMVVRDEDGVELRVRFDHVHGELVLAAIDSEAKTIRTERTRAAAVDPTVAGDPNGRAACDEDRSAERLTVAGWRALGLLRLAERSAAETPEGLQRSGFDTTVVVHVGIDTLYGPDLPDPTLDPSEVDGRTERHRLRDEMCELEPAGGHDDIENIAPECLEHHLAIHAHGIRITRDPDGTLHHWRPDGTEILADPTLDHPSAPNALHAPAQLTRRRLALGADPAETARQPRWHGDPAHLGDCIAAILTRRRQALARTHPTGAPPTLHHDMGPAPDPN